VQFRKPLCRGILLPQADHLTNRECVERAPVVLPQVLFLFEVGIHGIDTVVMLEGALSIPVRFTLVTS